jgi:hypothetical protein
MRVRTVAQHWPPVDRDWLPAFGLVGQLLHLGQIDRSSGKESADRFLQHRQSLTLHWHLVTLGLSAARAALCES